MTDERDPRRPAASTGALGGAANEQGSQLRASVGALCAAGLPNGMQLSALGMRGVAQVPKTIVAEGDGPVDDPQVGCISGARVLIQVKLSAGLGAAAGAPIDEAVRQFMPRPPPVWATTIASSWRSLSPPGHCSTWRPFWPDTASSSTGRRRQRRQRRWPGWGRSPPVTATSTRCHA